MAIATYNDLAAAVKVWAARTDSTFSNQIETFVTMHEIRMYNGSGGNERDPLWCPGLSAPEQETTGTVAFVDGVGTIPPLASTIRTIKRDGDLAGLEYLSPRQFAIRDADVSGGDPYYYTLDGTELKLTPTYTGDIDVSYYTKFTGISVDNQSNALLTAYPMLYLAGVLFEAFSFLQETDLALGHFARYRAMVTGINSSANSVRFGGGPMRVRVRNALP